MLKPRMSCLAEAATNLLASKPRLGGLEYDFGNLNDIITPKLKDHRLGEDVDDAKAEQASNAIRS
jgi:hypothetical protein